MQNLILDRYQPIQVAGQGGFGEVVVAWDTRIQRKVAIKCIELRDSQINAQGETISISQQETLPVDANKTQAINDKAETRVIKRNKLVDNQGEHWADNIPGLNEARTAAMIQDANIVTVYDFEFQNNMAYIIMEYVEGTTLTRFLHDNSDAISLDMITCIFAGVSHAIKVAHSQNVLHLDIKPDNVLIDTKGKVKVTDFGLATLADEFGYGTANAGTIGYMPPEQMRQQGLDVRSDLWSLASIMYEMLTGSNPFNAKDIPSAINKIYDCKLAAPSAYWDDLNPIVNDILIKALSPDMNARYISVKEFSDDISHYLGNAKSGQKQITEATSAAAMPQYDPKAKEAKEKNFYDSKVFGVLGHVAGGLLAGFITALASVNLPFCGGAQVSFAPTWAFWLIEIAGIAFGAIWPFAGIAFGCVALGVSLIFYQNIVVGIIFITITLLWSVFSGYVKPCHGITSAGFAVFGSFGFSQAMPLLTGIFCKPQYAAINTAFGFCVCLILGAMGTQTLFGWEPFNYFYWGSMTINGGNIQNSALQMITDPGVLILGASWIVSSVVISAMFNFQGRGLRIFGACLSSLLLVSGLLVSVYISMKMTTFTPAWWQTLPTIIACVLAILVTILMPGRIHHNYIDMPQSSVETDQIK